MENTLAWRIYDFLKSYPPFSLMEKDTLLAMAGKVVVQYRQPGEMIFQEGEAPGAYFYVVKEGAVYLTRQQQNGEPVLVEQCDEGDVFGIRPLLAERNYVLSAQASEESLIYAVPTQGMDQIIAHNPKVAYYLATSFAAGPPMGEMASLQPRVFIDPKEWDNRRFSLVEIQSIDHSKRPVTCLAACPIRQAAEIMTGKEVGSIIIVNEKNHPLGIVTDKDLRRKVATGLFGLEQPIGAIMSAPVITVPPRQTVADVQMEMVRHHIHHLCITEDGTNQSPILGVISEHDLLVLQANNPAVLIRESKRVRSGRELRLIREQAEELLKKYIFQEVSIAFISSVMTEVNDALMTRAIELAELEMESEGYDRPAVGFCWLMLGSQGREEQLLRTDQDNALIFENVSEADYPDVKSYFLSLATRTTEILNEVGFDYCPGEMMASNPEWCLSLNDWKRQFSYWIQEPTPKAVMFSTIFFDYRPVFGNTALADDLTQYIFAQIKADSIFLSFMAKDALTNPPPLTFFRNFVVEKSGEHKDEFDIKLRAMMPLTDAARVLILASKVGQINNTFRRFEKLAELEPQNRELFEQAADAYEILMRYRTLQGLRNKNSGRFFDPAQLSKMERLHLRNSFQPIRELQSLLRVRFSLSLLT